MGQSLPGGQHHSAEAQGLLGRRQGSTLAHCKKLYGQNRLGAAVDVYCMSIDIYKQREIAKDTERERESESERDREREGKREEREKNESVRPRHRHTIGRTRRSLIARVCGYTLLCRV